MGVKDYKNDDTKCQITFISRRIYGGRTIQRIWINEDEAVNRMVDDFGDYCSIKAADFTELSMEEQMRLIVDSDVVIGMHGAGMVNVMWTRLNALVIEVFPQPRRRWGFRNIFQYVGCTWHGFRGGEDVPSKGAPVTDGRATPNSNDEIVPPDEWAAFANPLVHAAIARTIGKV